MKLLLKLLSLAYLLVSSFYVNAQIDCNSYYKKDSLLKQESFIQYEELPKPIGSYDSLYKLIISKTQNITVSGKVYIKFIVDTSGYVHCSKVIKSDNNELDKWAIQLVEEIKFIPAMNHGKKVTSIMILPIIFGGQYKNEKKKRE